ncbi:MAG TPA: CDP-alcohol phosphatidyltransferase family protein [Oculatellaceae cyanobacterium]
MINVANVVTVGRVVVALGTLPILWQTNDTMLWTAFGLTAFVIYADALDGYLARKFNLSSKLGGILDIAGDRAVEMAYWVAFGALNWIPVWVPLTFLIRGTFVDAIRSALSEKGYTAFGTNTMMQSPIGKFIVASNFMRFTYAVVKAVAFCLMIAAHTSIGSQYNLLPIALGCVYAATVFCVVRGVPVLLESKGLF